LLNTAIHDAHYAALRQQLESNKKQSAK
jgi:hypothetical protein